MAEACRERNNVIYDAYHKYVEVGGGTICDEVRVLFREMILVNTLEFAGPVAYRRGGSADEYFYCFQSAGAPDVVLIGGTKDLEHELEEFNLERPTDPFVHLAIFRTRDAVRDTRLAHQHFAGVYVPGVEGFFRTSIESVCRYYQVRVALRAGCS